MIWSRIEAYEGSEQRSCRICDGIGGKSLSWLVGVLGEMEIMFNVSGYRDVDGCSKAEKGRKVSFVERPRWNMHRNPMTISDLA